MNSCLVDNLLHNPNDMYLIDLPLNYYICMENKIIDIIESSNKINKILDRIDKAENSSVGANFITKNGFVYKLSVRPSLLPMNMYNRYIEIALTYTYDTNIYSSNYIDMFVMSYSSTSELKSTVRTLIEFIENR